MSTQIGAIIFGCMDSRFQSVLHRYAQEQVGQNNYDCVCVKGGGAFVEQVVDHCRVAIQLHQPKRIILTAHENCGAGATIQSLNEAKSSIEQTFPDRCIETHWFPIEAISQNT